MFTNNIWPNRQVYTDKEGKALLFVILLMLVITILVIFTLGGSGYDPLNGIGTLITSIIVLVTALYSSVISKPGKAGVAGDEPKNQINEFTFEFAFIAALIVIIVGVLIFQPNLVSDDDIRSWGPLWIALGVELLGVIIGPITSN